MTVTRFVALDIETDTNAVPVDPDIPGGLDPRAGGITSIALHSKDETLLIDDHNERRLLLVLAAWFRECDRNTVFVSWNGASFDFPFLAARATQQKVLLPLMLELNPNLVPKYGPLPGFEGGYTVEVANGYGNILHHVDIAYLYKEFAETHGVSWSLKPVAQHVGIDMIHVDRENVAGLSVGERVAYNLSDVVGTLALTDKLVEKHPVEWLLDQR